MYLLFLFFLLGDASSSVQTNVNSSSALVGLKPPQLMTTRKPLNKKRISKSAAIDIDDILLEIFIRLPLHSIQRFKTVCKHWKTLINSPTFPKLWREHNIKPSTGLILLTRVPMSVYFIPFSPNNPTTLGPIKTKLKIIQSCSGLLLCSTKTRYHVYNPANNTYHTLPELGRDIVWPGTRIRSVTLAFDPKKFGSQYKVICCVTCVRNKYPLDVHVYSSDTHVWKSAFNIRFTLPVSDRGVYWNGSIHWMYELTYFNIENGTFHVMPGPPAGSQWRMNYQFGESCDRLSITKLWKTTEGEAGSLDVYELKKDYSEWVLKYFVELNDLPLVTSVVSLVHGVERHDSFLILKAGEGFVRYNLGSETSEVLPFLLTHGTVDRAFQYIESHFRV